MYGIPAEVFKYAPILQRTLFYGLVNMILPHWYGPCAIHDVKTLSKLKNERLLKLQKVPTIGLIQFLQEYLKNPHLLNL